VKIFIDLLIRMFVIVIVFDLLFYRIDNPILFVPEIIVIVLNLWYDLIVRKW
jgi:hypothetical protein